jgi:putative transposase
MFNMVRRARLAIAGIPWHVIHRGNNRSRCFFTSSDYSYYLGTLAEQAVKFDCLIHAYVLMTNHVHLLITPARETSAALLMKNLAQRHTQLINRRDNRTGTLWEGRFKSCLAQDDAYVLTCYRYIELNPVRAGMVDNPGSYYWSSYGVNGDGKSSSVITPHADYLALGADTNERLARYRKSFSALLSETELRSIRRATNGNFVLGTDSYLSALQAQLDRQVAPLRRAKPTKGDRPLTAQKMSS